MFDKIYLINSNLCSDIILGFNKLDVIKQFENKIDHDLPPGTGIEVNSLKLNFKTMDGGLLLFLKQYLKDKLDVFNGNLKEVFYDGLEVYYDK